jgi:hypothetical protein
VIGAAAASATGSTWLCTLARITMSRFWFHAQALWVKVNAARSY